MAPLRNRYSTIGKNKNICRNLILPRLCKICPVSHDGHGEQGFRLCKGVGHVLPDTGKERDPKHVRQLGPVGGGVVRLQEEQCQFIGLITPKL